MADRRNDFRRPLAAGVRRVNLRVRWFNDLYHRALMLRWYEFLALGCATYLGVNVVFALLYRLQPGSIAGAGPGFSDAFFFSIQTIATIGYGQMSPATFYANVLVTLETMAGLVFLALATGVTFARISRPTARVLFAETAVISRHNGVPTLSLRMANERRSQILEADVTLSLLRYETSLEGVGMRRFYPLTLLRSHTPVFTLSFTILHQIDDGSPLHGSTQASLEAEGAELLVSVTGLEEVTSQTVHARGSYKAADFQFGRRYRDIIIPDGEGLIIDFGRFHDTEPAE